jgi:hypothetical protein
VESAVKGKFMKKILLILSILVAQIVYADFLKSRPVGPGIIHHHVYRSAGPWHIQVLEINRADSLIQFETVKAMDRLAAREQTSSMAGRSDHEQHRVVGAINGDFYDGNGIPIGAQVLNGLLLKLPYPRSVFGLTGHKIPFINIVSFNGKILSADGSEAIINGINESRDENELILYNKYFGTTTGTDYWGTELVVKFLFSPEAVNDTFFIQMISKDSILAAGHGNNSIPADGVVISGHGLVSDYLNAHLFAGDTAGIILNLPPLTDPVTELIGAMPRLIRDGIVSVEWQQEGIYESFVTTRHPRTAVGYNQDFSKIYLITVDGRQPDFSVGMSLYELADYMLEWGIYQGVNLDGGGSTTMVVRGEVVNSPSDATGERAVSNGLMIICTAATGSLSKLLIQPEDNYVLIGRTLQFTVKGYDANYTPLTLQPELLNWSCDNKIGSITSGGLFTAGSQTDSGFVYVQQGLIADTVMVYVTTIASINLSPNPVILKVGEQQQITPQARDNLQNVVSLSVTDYEWTVSDSIGSLTAGGLFAALKAGSGQINASYQSVQGICDVFIGTAADVILDDFSQLDNWSLTGVLVNNSDCALTPDSSQVISLPTSGKLHYNLLTGGTSALYLNGSLPVSGTPDEIGLYVYGDGRGHWLRGELWDANSEKFLVDFTKADPGINWQNSWKFLEVSMDSVIPRWDNPAAILNFPITWKKIYLAEVNDSKKDSGTVYFDDFTASYLNSIGAEPVALDPKVLTLHQNYPNPFNPLTTIRYFIPGNEKVMLTVHDITGKKLETLVDENQNTGYYQTIWRSDHYSSGVYFYSLSVADRVVATRKMVVLK